MAYVLGFLNHLGEGRGRARGREERSDGHVFRDRLGLELGIIRSLLLVAGVGVSLHTLSQHAHHRHNSQHCNRNTHLSTR